jgi:hypothetical protein
VSALAVTFHSAAQERAIPADRPRAITFTKDVALERDAKNADAYLGLALVAADGFDRKAREYAEKIKRKVSQRLMPPWHIDRTIGIQEFKNDRGLSDEQIATLVGWVDAGAPLGDPKDMPPARFPDPTGWQFAREFGAPDLVIKSTPYAGAHTQDKWFRPVTETGLTEPRWVRAIEIRPTSLVGRRTVHHVLASLEQKEADGVEGLAHSAHDVQTTAGLFMEWAVGKTGQIFPKDAGKLMLPGSRIRWEIHMFAIGEEVRNNQSSSITSIRAPAHHRSGCLTSAADATDIPPARSRCRRTTTCCRPRRAWRISSRTCTCAGRCRWRPLPGRPQGSAERRQPASGTGTSTMSTPTAPRRSVAPCRSRPGTTTRRRTEQPDPRRVG